MAGGRARSYRLGDRSEHLVEHLLSALAFTTPAPRQQDVGYDFFCSLISREGHLLKAGAFFTVQAKSSARAIYYRKKHEIEWITSQENPLLICVAHRAELAVDVYSTWNLLCGPLAKGLPTKLALLPGVARSAWPGVEFLEDGTQQVRLGRPIARIGMSEAYDDERMAEASKVVGDWIALDRANILNSHSGMHWVIGPLDWETGRSPHDTAQGIGFYWHLENLVKSANNLGKAAASIALILRDAVLPEVLGHGEWQYKRDVLRDVLRAYWDMFDDGLKAALSGQGFDPK